LLLLNAAKMYIRKSTIKLNLFLRETDKNF
jgi:hypothetical protein